MGNDKGAKTGEEEETVPIGGKEFGVTETKWSKFRESNQWCQLLLLNKINS